MKVKTLMDQFRLNGENSAVIGKSFDDEVNTWLRQNPNIKILHLQQSCCQGMSDYAGVIVTIWYEDKEGDGC